MSKTFVAAVLFAAATSASAQQTTIMDQSVPGPGACQAALPAFEGLIRKRPLAIQNEGDANAFVTCAPHHLVHGDNYDYGIGLVNNGEVARTVACTIITRHGEAPAQYDAASTEIAPGQAGSVWHYDYDGGEGAIRSSSCVLPPGVGITDVMVRSDLEIVAVDQ